MAVTLALSGGLLAVVGLTVARVVPRPVQSSYLGSYAKSTSDAWNSAAGVMLSSPTVRSALSRSGPGVLESLLGSRHQSSGLTVFGAFPPAGGSSSVTRSVARAMGARLPAVVRAAQKNEKPVAQLSEPAGPDERAATVELAVPITDGHRVVAVIAATGPAASLKRSIHNEVAKINLVLGMGFGLVWGAAGALAWRHHYGRESGPSRGQQPARTRTFDIGNSSWTSEHPAVGMARR